MVLGGSAAIHVSNGNSTFSWIQVPSSIVGPADGYYLFTVSDGAIDYTDIVRRRTRFIDTHSSNNRC